MRKFLRFSIFVFSTALLISAQTQSLSRNCTPIPIDSSTSHCEEHDCSTANVQDAENTDKSEHNCPQHQHSQGSCPQGHCMHHVNCIYMIPAQSLLASSSHSSLHFSRIENWIPSDFINQLLRPPCA